MFGFKPNLFTHRKHKLIIISFGFKPNYFIHTSKSYAQQTSTGNTKAICLFEWRSVLDTRECDSVWPSVKGARWAGKRTTSVPFPVLPLLSLQKLWSVDTVLLALTTDETLKRLSSLPILIIIIMYIYLALINALSAHMIHINIF